MYKKSKCMLLALQTCGVSCSSAPLCSKHFPNNKCVPLSFTFWLRPHFKNLALFGRESVVSQLAIIQTNVNVSVRLCFHCIFKSANSENSTAWVPVEIFYLLKERIMQTLSPQRFEWKTFIGHHLKTFL